MQLAHLVPEWDKTIEVLGAWYTNPVVPPAILASRRGHLVIYMVVNPGARASCTIPAGQQA